MPAAENQITVIMPSLWTQVKRNRNAYLFIAPFYLLFLAFMAFPICFSFVLSLLSWNGIMAPRFVGLRHYTHALRDPGLGNALLNTLIFAVVTVTVSTTIGFGLALFLNSVRFLKRFYRGVFFVPAIVSLVVVALVWKLILNPEFGAFHELMMRMGRLVVGAGNQLPAWATHRYHFIDNPKPMIPLITITMIHVWAVIGFNTVIYLAGLQGIPAQLYDAARIDGASPFQCMRRITIPLLRPTTFFVVLITTIDALQIFVLPNIMNRDSEATMTIVYYLFRNAFDFYKMGYASAVAYLLFALTVGLGLAIRATLGRDARWAQAE